MHVSSDLFPFPSGDRLDDVRLLDLIGFGSSGTVFRAEKRSPTTGTEEPHGRNLVAVKLPNAGANLADEALFLRRFAHPNVVRVLSDHTASPKGELAGSIILELCDEGNLEDRVMRQALTAHEVHDVVKSVGSALVAIHEAGWIHGDVTPSNIGLRSFAPPCLLDFETCRPADGSSADTETRGTREFSEPSMPSMPVFDVRSLAATALWALGAPEEFSLDDHAVANGLTRFISNCDASSHNDAKEPESCSLEDLYSVFSGIEVFSGTETLSDSSTECLGPLPCHMGSVPSTVGHQGRSRTRRFGPGPIDPFEQAETCDQPNKSTYPRRRAVALVGLLALSSLVLVELLGSSRAAAIEPIDERVVNVVGRTAERSLEGAGVAWSVEDGSAQLIIDGVATTFTPGQRGDLAAVGDWDCDGTETLGIFRPSTGAWFTFSSWTIDAISTVEVIADPNTSTSGLSVESSASGCARPVVS